MQNSKDLSKVETYYNKRYGKDGVSKILAVVNEKFLDGAALKASQSASEVGEQVKPEVD